MYVLLKMEIFNVFIHVKRDAGDEISWVAVGWVNWLMFFVIFYEFINHAIMCLYLGCSWKFVLRVVKYLWFIDVSVQLSASYGGMHLSLTFLLHRMHSNFCIASSILSISIEIMNCRPFLLCRLLFKCDQ